MYPCALTIQNISPQMQLLFNLTLSLWSPKRHFFRGKHTMEYEKGPQRRKRGWTINAFILSNIWTHIQQWSFSICPTLFSPNGQCCTHKCHSLVTHISINKRLMHSKCILIILSKSKHANKQVLHVPTTKALPYTNIYIHTWILL